ncbi:MAG: MFS transporter [Deltaproteobacteria bacterium]|nr:MFS transporter [Deltaproteobacteria bacterium]
MSVAALRSDLRALAASPRELWIVYLMKFLESVGYFTMYSMLPLYLSDDFAMSDEGAAGVTGTWTSAISIFVFVAGFIADAMGVKRALLIAALSTAVGRMLLAFSPSLPAAYVALALGVWGVGSMKPTMNAAVRNFAAPAAVAFGFSLYYVVMNLGSLSQGPIITNFREWFKAGVTLGDAQLSAAQCIFLVGGVCSTINVLLALAMRENPPGAAPPATDRERNPLLIAKEVLVEKTFWVFMAFVGLLTLVRLIFQHAHLTWPKYTLRSFGDDFEFAYYWSLNPLLVILLTPAATALTRRFPPYPVIVFGSVISALSVFAMGLSTTVAASVVFIVVLSIGEILWSPRLYEYTATIAPRGRESSYMGLSEVPLFLAKPVAAVISGWMLSRYCPAEGARDPETMWLIIGAFTLAAPVVMLFTRRWLEAPERAA